MIYYTSKQNLNPLKRLQANSDTKTLFTLEYITFGLGDGRIVTNENFKNILIILKKRRDLKNK